MEPNKWNIGDIYNIIKNGVEDPSILPTQNATNILIELNKLNNDNNEKLVIHNFSFTNQEHVDILELSELFNQNNLFAYYLANTKELSFNHPLDAVIAYLFKHSESEQTILYEQQTQNYLIGLNVEINTEESKKIWEELKNKLIAFCNYVFYLFSIDLYKPSKTKTNVEIFHEYKQWILNNIMVEKSAKM